MSAKATNLETDSRFPSGRWLGYFLQRCLVGEQDMELQLTFANGKLRGEGRDFVGEFVLSGDYSLESGECSWWKQYVGQHNVHYKGVNEGQGIWGVWQIVYFGRVLDHEGFHIWPEGMADPRLKRLKTANDLPATNSSPVLMTEDVDEYDESLNPELDGVDCSVR